MSDKSEMTWKQAVAWLISQPKHQQLVKDCYFDASIQQAASRYVDSSEWTEIEKLLPENATKALDLGAGRGIASYALATIGWQVSAIEPDESDLVGAGAIETLASENNLPITVSKVFGEKIDFELGTFDLVFARQVLHHANDLQQLCHELFRVLKPGAKFIAVRDHVVSSPADLNKFYDVHPLHHLYGGEYAYTLKAYLTAMRSAGFDIVKVLRPFDSVINYAPYNYETLREAFKVRLAPLPLGSLLSSLLDKDVIFNLVLRMLSRFDRRPGRLYSFVCQKPMEKA